MNNLKRVLSLGLVGAMLSGMMIMGASAATYSDAEDIENVEAVEIMGALNIINGKDNGTFDPEGFVTRAEMAKMIAVAMNGGKEPNFGVKANPTFTDTKGHWAETFIEYCSDMKIINGRGDGTFDPAGNVTGVEAAKMVLSALGYEAEAYRLTGAEWEGNVNRNATQVCDPSLYDTVENVVMSQPINRDTAAQIIWNGIQNNVVEVNPDKTVTSGEVTERYEKSDKNFLAAHYGAQIGYGYLVGNDKTDSISKGHIKINGYYADNATAETIEKVKAKPGDYTVNFPWDTDLSLIGEKVKVIFKDGKNGSSKTPDKNDTIYGVFNANETEVVTGTMADVKKIEDDDQVINIGGTKYDLANNVQVTFNYANDRTGETKAYSVTTAQADANTVTSANDLRGTTDGKTESALTTALLKTRGDAIKAILDDNKVVSIYVTESNLEFVTAVSADKVTITNVGTLKKADNDIYDGIAKDDVVVVTTLYKKSATADEAFNIVEKAEVVTGEMTRYKDKESVTVDGTVYKVYDKAADALRNNGDFEPKLNVDDLIGEEFELYMVNGFVRAAKKISESASNYSVILAVRTNITGTGDVFDDLRLQVMAADGTKSIITVDKDSKQFNSDTKITAASNYHVGDIVTYTLDKNGDATVTIEAQVDTATDKVTYNEDKKSVVFDKGVVGSEKAYVTNADCVLFVDTGSTSVSYKAYTIRNLKNIDNSSNYAVVLDDDNKVVAVSLKTGATPAGAGSSRVYGMVTGYNGVIRQDNTAYRQYTISVNGESYTVNWKSDNAVNPDKTAKIAKGDVVSFEPTSDGIYEESGSFVKLGNDATIGSDGTAKAVLVKEYVPADGIISVFTSRQAYDKDNNKVADDATNIARYEGEGSFTYAVDDDVKMYYVDNDNDTAMEAGTVSTMNTMTGYKSAFLVVDGNDVVIAIIAEVSGEKDITK